MLYKTATARHALARKEQNERRRRRRPLPLGKFGVAAALLLRPSPVLVLLFSAASPE